MFETLAKWSAVWLSQVGGSGATMRLGPDVAIALRVSHNVLYPALSKYIQWAGFIQVATGGEEKADN